MSPIPASARASTWRQRRRWLALAALLAAISLAAPGGAATRGAEGASGSLDVRLVLDHVGVGFERPVQLVGDGLGDAWVVEKVGRITQLHPDGLAGRSLLDISDRVLDAHERGLLGLAFHPDFADNGRFFVAYSRRGDGATSISEFTLPGEPEPPDAGEEPEVPTPVERTERPLLVIPQPYTTHKGGALLFDREGILTVGVGDGGSAWDPHDNAQDPTSLLGKVLRLDVDDGWPYAAPEDNGFWEWPPSRKEVHAVGLRNPWRMSLDRATGDIYIGDVGQDEHEEINLLRPGERWVNYGWKHMDGLVCHVDDGCDEERYRRPAIMYQHADGDIGHCAVVGGHAYRGAAGSLPDGTYVYGDYCSGTIWGVPAEELVAGSATPTIIGGVDPTIGQIQGFGEDDAGELFVLTSNGDVFHLRSG